MMDNIDLEGATMDELILQNAESMKQFEYLEKSLVTFQQAVSAQASELRQPIGECEKGKKKVSRHSRDCFLKMSHTLTLN